MTQSLNPATCNVQSTIQRIPDLGTSAAQGHTPFTIPFVCITPSLANIPSRYHAQRESQILIFKPMLSMVTVWL